MSSKFSPKFTIATAYPMMYSSSDLKYIESEMLHSISTDAASSRWEASEPSNYAFLDTIETPTDCYRWVKHAESQRSHTLRQLERIWQSGSEDSPRKGYKQP